MSAHLSKPAVQSRTRLLRSWRRTTIAALALAIAAAPASATAAGPTEVPDEQRHPTIAQVRGRQLPVDADRGTFRMRGDLIGHWTVLSADTLPGYSIPEAPWTLAQSGQEQFHGCIDRTRDGRCNSTDPSGELRFDYLLWITYDRNTAEPIEGNCVHLITNGTGDLADAHGVLTTHDLPVGHGDVVTTYEGKIVLHALPGERNPVPQRAGARPASGARAAGC